MTDGDPEPSSARTDVHGIKRGRFTVTRLHRSGPRPHRVLLVGSRSQLAPARLPQAEALGERIADRIWLRSRRGVDLDMLWELRPVLRAIGEGFSSWRLWRYDAVIIVSVARPVRLVARLQKPGIDRLLQRIIRELGTASHVLLVSLGRTNAAGGTRASDSTASARVSSLRTSSDVRTGADRIAARITKMLDAADSRAEGGDMDAAHRRRQQPDAEDERQRALDALALRKRRVGRRLQHVVELAQDAFDTATAEITIIDHDRQWTLVGVGDPRGETGARDSICSRSIRRSEPTLIGDTWTVPALRGNPLIVGPSPIRFYAAHPIESIDGYRIGVLCVWDDVPYDVEDFDLSALRDLALLAEAEIIGGGEG